jgi:hypothetical protein
MITNRFVRMLGIAVLTATSGAACSSSPTDEVAVQEGTGTTEEAISATGFGLSQFHTVLPNGFGGRAVAVTISPTNAGAALVLSRYSIPPDSCGCSLVEVE